MTYYTQDRWLSLFDTINLAQCAAKRAELSAGSADGRFKREYWTAHAWANLANNYRLCWSRPIG